MRLSDDIMWTRLSLPFRLDHVNVYFLRDGDGWAILDAGLADDGTKAAWETLLAGPLRREKFTRMIVSHFHPDHVGLAGWLCERLDVPLWCGRETYLLTVNALAERAKVIQSPVWDFFRANGMSHEIAEITATRGLHYQTLVSPLPVTYRRLIPGQILSVGRLRFRILSGGGHCPEQIMLHDPGANLFLATDQVIEKISPNVSIQPFEPFENPLGAFLASLAEIKREIPEDALVLSGHHRPFQGLHERCDELTTHHAQRCDIILDTCRAGPQSAQDLLPHLFRPGLSSHETSFAFGETLAHMNHLIECGRLAWQVAPDGLRRVALPE
ncbi:MAG: MBL fold metallo-hydrolase [Pseudodonghicola sp.]